MAFFKRDKDKTEKEEKVDNPFIQAVGHQAAYEKAMKDRAELASYGTAASPFSTPMTGGLMGGPAHVVSNPIPVRPEDLKACELIGTTARTVLVRRGGSIQAYNLANYKPTEGKLTLFDLVVSYYKAVNRDEE